MSSSFGINLTAPQPVLNQHQNYLNLSWAVISQQPNSTTTNWTNNSLPNNLNNLVNSANNNYTSASSFNINNHNNNNQTNNKTILSDSEGTFFSDEYCSVGTVGCSFITIISVFHLLFIFYVLYKSYPSWRLNFKDNRAKFFTIDVDQNQMRDILAYGMKVFLQVIGGLEAIIQLVLVIAFHEQGWMMILEVSVTNLVCCFSTAIFIYLDAITFQRTLRRTFIIVLINSCQNLVIFAIILATGSGQHVDIFCFICSSIYISTCIAATTYTHFKMNDFMTVDLEQLDENNQQNTSSLLNTSQQNYHNLNSDQNLLQQQHTTLDYGHYRSQNNSNNNPNYQPPSQNYLPSFPLSKQSKIEDESSSRTNKSNQKQSIGFSQTKTTTPQNQNQNANNSSTSNNGSHSNTFVKRSLSAQKTPTLIPNTPEDSFSSINNYQSLSDEDDTADQKNNGIQPNNKNGNAIKSYQKKIDINKCQKERAQLANRSKSSIQCLGRQDPNLTDNSLDRIEEEQRVDQQISGFFIGDKWSGSVDIMDNQDKSFKNQKSSNISTSNTNTNTTVNNNLISNLKQYHHQMNNSNIHQQFHRQPTNQTDVLHSSVEYLGCSNQFITPSFTNHQPHIESHTNSSSNRDSLYLSQQITTPQFNHINQLISSNQNNSLQSSSASSSKKPHSSLFSQKQQQIDQQQFGNVNPNKNKSNLSSANHLDGNIQQSPSVMSVSPSLGIASGDTNTYMNSSANDNSEMSNQKQDSFQTSDSYLMNGGQNNNNNNTNQQQQNQLIQQQQSAFSKAIKTQQQVKSPQQNQHELDKKAKEQLSKQKSLNGVTSPQTGPVKGSPQTDLNSKTQDKQHVLNQMNVLLFKNKSSQNIQPQQQQSQQQQSPSHVPNTSERSIGKVQKSNLQEEQKKMPPQQSSQESKRVDNSSMNMNNNNNNSNYSVQHHRKHSDNLPNRNKDNDEDNLGYYQERYSELKVLSFKQSEKFDKRTVVFNISYFDSKGEIVVIQRSYREFNDLNKYLSTRYRQFKFSEFPKKQNKLQLSSQELTDRTNQFNIYLQSVTNQIKTEVNVINHFLSKETVCFSSQAVLRQQPLTPTNQGEQTKSFAQMNSNTNSSSSNKLPYKKLNSLPNKPRSVPETIFEDDNDCSNVLTDSNASQMDNDDDYSSMSCNYQHSNKSSNYSSNYNQNKNNSNIPPSTSSAQSSKTVSPIPSRKPSTKQ